MAPGTKVRHVLSTVKRFGPPRDLFCVGRGRPLGLFALRSRYSDAPALARAGNPMPVSTRSSRIQPGAMSVTRPGKAATIQKHGVWWLYAHGGQDSLIQSWYVSPASHGSQFTLLFVRFCVVCLDLCLEWHTSSTCALPVNQFSNLGPSVQPHHAALQPVPIRETERNRFMTKSHTDYQDLVSFATIEHHWSTARMVCLVAITSLVPTPPLPGTYDHLPSRVLITSSPARW